MSGVRGRPWFRRIVWPHLLVAVGQVVVAVLGTVGILTCVQSANGEVLLGAGLAVVDSVAPAAAHAAISRRYMARQVRAVLSTMDRVRRPSA